MQQQTKSSKGKEAEDLARRFLDQQGLSFIECNYRCRAGEIDLIMQDKKSLVFVEVRYRSRTDFGDALESVNQAKQQRLIHAADHYLQSHHKDVACRFDVVGISGDKKPVWIQNAFGN